MKHYLKIIVNHKQPIRFVLARLLMATRLCRWLKIKQRGYCLWFHPANLSSQLWIERSCREESLKFFREYLKPGDCVVDVGANIGDTVLTSSRCVGPQGHVTGIEAHPRTFAFFTENLKLNSAANVTAVHSAVGRESGKLRFSDDFRDDMNRVDGGDLEVPVDTLDRLVHDETIVNLLKVDVEGYEKFVFEGASELLRRTECVYFEVSSLHFAQYSYTTEDLLQLLYASGFKIYKETRFGILSLVPVEYDTENFENLIAIRCLNNFISRTGWDVVK